MSCFGSWLMRRPSEEFETSVPLESMSQSLSDHSQTSPSMSALGNSAQQEPDKQMYVSSRTPQPDASESGPGEVKHTAFEHSMAAGFVNAPPRLRSSNLGQPDHKRRNSAAFQTATPCVQAFAPEGLLQGARYQHSSGYASDIAAEASSHSLAGTAQFPRTNSNSQSHEHLVQAMETEDTNGFSWDYIKSVPSASSSRLSRDILLRSRVQSIRGSLDYEFDHDMPVATRRSKNCGERGVTSSSLSGRSFPSQWSDNTTHE